MDEFLLGLRDDHTDFDQGRLDDVIKNIHPMRLFQKWFKEAYEKDCSEPNAMVISTVSDGQPSSRTVYMKELLEEGIVFYTNYNSKKAKDIADNPKVSLLFYWNCLERQVRIQGVAVKAPVELSDDYFASRPRKSQIGAWASAQSEEIADRETLEKNYQEIETKFKDYKTLPRPEFWGGYLIQPNYFEFWHGRPGRLHDRICFEKNDQSWMTSRINP